MTHHNKHYDTKRTMLRREFIGLIGLTGCAAIPAMLPVIGTLAEGATWLAGVLDDADAGQNAYFDRHPSFERERLVKQTLDRARAAVRTLSALAATGNAAKAGDLTRARLGALTAYDELYLLLEEFGILDGRAPDGGADGRAPDPAPLILPTHDEVASRL